MRTLRSIPVAIATLTAHGVALIGAAANAADGARGGAPAALAAATMIASVRSIIVP